MSGAVFLSRILGLLREQVFAFFFGAGLATDAYLVAFRIPNLFRDLFAEGALSSAFVTIFSREKSDERSREMARNVLLALLSIVTLVCVLIFVFSESLVGWMAPDFSNIPGKYELTVELTRYLSPFLFLVSGAALAMGILNTKGHFFVPALGSAAFNLGNIVVGAAAAWLLQANGTQSMIVGFAVGSVVGGALQWMIQWPLLARQGFAPWQAFSNLSGLSSLQNAFSDPALKQITLLMAPSILSVAAVQVNVFVNTVIASSLIEGSVSWLNYAFRLMHFPMGVFGVALAVASLPNFSRLIHEHRHDEFQDAFKKALRLTWVLALGSTAGLIAFREPLMSLIFEYGRFTRTDTLQSAIALTAFVLALPALNTTKIFVQVFYAHNKVWIPSSVALVLVVAHYYAALWGADHYGHVGLALATAATSWLNTLVLGFVIRFWGYKLFDWQSFKLLVAALLGALMIISFEIFGGADYLLAVKDTSQWSFALLTLFSISAMGSLYLLLCSYASDEALSVLMRLLRRIKR